MATKKKTVTMADVLKLQQDIDSRSESLMKERIELKKIKRQIRREEESVAHDLLAKAIVADQKSPAPIISQATLSSLLTRYVEATADRDILIRQNLIIPTIVPPELAPEPDAADEFA